MTAVAHRLASAAALFIAATGTYGAEPPEIQISGPDLLPVHEAFAPAAYYDGGSITVSFEIADGYYLYRDRFFVRALNNGTSLGKLELPPGTAHIDEFFGEVFTFRNSVAFSVPVMASAEAALAVEIISQGCAEAGVCYPPARTVFSFPKNGGSGTQVPVDGFAGASSAFSTNTLGATPDLSQKALSTLLRSSWLTVLALFFVSGLLLSFTPCVLPMVPVVLGIVSRDAKAGSYKAITLCLSYIAGTAATYGALGVLTAQTGQFAASYLQNFWVLSSVALIFTMFGFSMLGIFKFRMPFANWFAAKASKAAARSGSHPAAFTLGILATAVLSPCAAPPFIGALLFITQTGDTLVGVSALVAMAAGMGVLLLAAAAGAGSLLPKIGQAGSVAVRRLFGLLLLGMALWIASSLLPGPLRLLLYGALAFSAFWIVTGLSWAAARHGPGTVRRLAGLSGMLLALSFGGTGAIMTAGGLSGGDNELAPLANLSVMKNQHLEFATIVTPAALDDTVANGGNVTMVDFYADWCVNCKAIEARTYGDSRVMSRLAGLNLVRADVTEKSRHSEALLSRYGLYGPPAAVFLDVNGRVLAKIVGYHGPDEFLAIIDSIAEISRGTAISQKWGLIYEHSTGLRSS